MRGSIVVAMTLAASVAHAHGPLVPGTQHTPPRFVDESHVLLHLTYSQSTTKGYRFYLKANVAGYTSNADTIRLDWKSHGKVVASAKCVGTGEPAPAGVSEISCDYGDKGIHAKGPIDAQLVYTDDHDDKDYLLRDFNVTVAQWPSFGDEVWQIMGDDLLGAAYARHLADGNAASAHKVAFSFWTTAPDKGHDWELRCTVNGTKIPDLDAAGIEGVGSIQADQVKKGTGAHTLYSWVQLVVVPNIYWGPKKEDKHPNAAWLIDHAGDWVCNLRTDAKNVRELRFHVNDQGMVESDPMAAAGPPLADGTALVDVRIPKDSKFDLRVRPAAMTKSRGYGLPWPKHPNVKAILGSLPPSSGLPDP